MYNFEPICTEAKFAPLIYYKNYNNKYYKNMFTIYDYETYRQKDRAKFAARFYFVDGP